MEYSGGETGANCPSCLSGRDFNRVCTGQIVCDCDKYFGVEANKCLPDLTPFTGYTRLSRCHDSLSLLCGSYTPLHCNGQFESPFSVVLFVLLASSCDMVLSSSLARSCIMALLSDLARPRIMVLTTCLAHTSYLVLSIFLVRPHFLVLTQNIGSPLYHSALFQIGSPSSFSTLSMNGSPLSFSPLQRTWLAHRLWHSHVNWLT